MPMETVAPSQSFMDTLDAIHKEIVSIQVKIEELQEELERKKTAANVVQTMIDGTLTYPSRGMENGPDSGGPKRDDKVVRSQSDRRSKPSRRGATPTDRHRVLEAAKKYMLRENRPLQPLEVLGFMTEEGVKLAGKNPSHAVRRTLSEMADVFYRVENRGYWILGVKLPDTPS